MRWKYIACAALLSIGAVTQAQDERWQKLAPYFSPPAQYADQLGNYRSPLKFEDGSEVKDAKDWPRRRAEILHKWTQVMGSWPELIERPKLQIIDRQPRDGY